MPKNFEKSHKDSLCNDFIHLTPDTNYWRKTSSAKGAFMVDGQSYYKAFREALIQAEHHICILAWDFMEDIDLIRDEEINDGLPTKLGDLLFALVERKPELEIYLLLWDYSIVYILEREWIPFTRLQQEQHPRIHLVKDSAINVGASHHQKVVSIDGDFAFCGGMDLSAWRWDSQEHAVNDSRRTTPKGESYQPYHDIHCAITGPAAEELDNLCRERWHRATGNKPPWQKPNNSHQVWPESLQPDFDQANTVFALTYSEYKEYPAVTQVEQLHLDMIAAAERYIYIENQYLSSHTITDALIDRLKEPEGPEVVIILTQDTGGWLEEGTLGLLRCRLLEKLQEADHHGRFGAYFPHVKDEDGNETQVYVHAKVLICDDRAVMIGSANLSNRSMKVDSEIMMALGLDESNQAAPNLLRRLLSIHLNIDANAIDSSLEDEKSINTTIRKLRTDNLHQLRDLQIGCANSMTRKLADTQLLDPSDPIDPGYWLSKALKGDPKPKKLKSDKSRYTKIAIAIIVVLLLGIALKESWGNLIDKESVETFFQALNQSAWTLPILFAVFFLAGLLAISINVLLISATLAIGPWAALCCGFLGSILSAVTAFHIGSIAGKPILEKFFADIIKQLGEKMKDRGIFSVALIRVVPIAPFVVINLIAGISKMKLRTFVAGSCLGMLPGMAAVVFTTHQAKNAYTDPSWQTWLLLGIGLATLIGLSVGIKKYLK